MMAGATVILYSLGLFGAFLLGLFLGLAVQRIAYEYDA